MGSTAFHQTRAVYQFQHPYVLKPQEVMVCQHCLNPRQHVQIRKPANTCSGILEGIEQSFRAQQYFLLSCQHSQMTSLPHATDEEEVKPLPSEL